MALGYDPRTAAYSQSLVNLPTMDTAPPGTVAPKPAIPGSPFPDIRSFLARIQGAPDPTITPDAPSAAAAAAGATAQKAATPQSAAEDAGTSGRPGMFPQIQPAAPGANDDWNAFAARQLGGMGVPNAAAVLGQTQPNWDKAAGEAAMRTTDGSARRLNYGYGTEIVGSGNANGKLNSFTGVGQGPAPAGPAGVFGAPPGGRGSPLSQLQDHITSLMDQHQTLSNRGDLAGALQARGIRHYLASLAPLQQAAMAHEYQMGSLGVAQRHQTLSEQVAGPDIDVNRFKADQIANNKLVEARRAAAAMSGHALTEDQTEQPGTYVRDPDTGKRKFLPYPSLKPEDNR